MNEKIALIKNKIKEYNPDLYKKFISFSVSDEEILDKENIIFNYLTQDKNTYFKYIIDVNRNGKILEYSTINSKNTNLKYKINKIKENYLSSFENDELYQIDLFNDIYKKKDREILFKKIENIIKGRVDNIFTKGYWLKGNFGVGKTYISIAFLNKLAEKNNKVAYLFLPEFSSSFNSNIQENITFLNKIEFYKNSNILLIDDIGSEKTSEWFRNNILFTILNYREQNKKLTLFTSNISINNYQKKLILKSDEQDKLSSLRIIERIKALADEIDLKGQNYRN
ncbi:MAG: hypothetical protein HPAVJP_4530 [Candidatus Hepatoplasma vulgare]|nr:MAG: hypothetical protein HPAVJP_4530 [Candidatus Hepatoplasma sp.]